MENKIIGIGGLLFLLIFAVSYALHVENVQGGGISNFIRIPTFVIVIAFGGLTLAKKEKYEFLKWDCELGDCVIFDMRTLHGTLNSSIPKKTLSRYTLRVAKEDSKISYDGDWTSFNYRKAMQDAGYKNGDPVEGKLFPTLYQC